jgi:hypothetical protein
MCANEYPNFSNAAHRLNLWIATTALLEQAGHVLADDQLWAEAPRVPQNALETLTCLASTIIDAFAVITPLCVLRKHGFAHEAGHEHIHNRDVGFLVSNDVESPAGLQVADVVEDQRQL